MTFEDDDAQSLGCAIYGSSKPCGTGSDDRDDEDLVVDLRVDAQRIGHLSGCGPAQNPTVEDHHRQFGWFGRLLEKLATSTLSAL